MNADGLKCVERYRLILRHEYITDEGDTIRLEDPIVVQMIIVPEAIHRYSEPVIVENMVDRLKSFLLDEIDRDRDPRWTQNGVIERKYDE